MALAVFWYCSHAWQVLRALLYMLQLSKLKKKKKRAEELTAYFFLPISVQVHYCVRPVRRKKKKKSSTQTYDVRKLPTSFSFWTTNFKDLPKTTQSTNLCINSSRTVNIQRYTSMPVSFSKANIFHSPKKKKKKQTCRNNFNFSKNLILHASRNQDLPISILKSLLIFNSVYPSFKLTFYSCW